jgi:hypothetical protein
MGRPDLLEEFHLRGGPVSIEMQQALQHPAAGEGTVRMQLIERAHQPKVLFWTGRGRA